MKSSASSFACVRQNRLHTSCGCDAANRVLRVTKRESLVREGHISHDALFFTHDFRAIPDVRYPYGRWHRTLKRLRLRHQK